MPKDFLATENTRMKNVITVIFTKIPTAIDICGSRKTTTIHITEVKPTKTTKIQRSINQFPSKLKAPFLGSFIYYPSKKSVTSITQKPTSSA